MRLPWWTKGLAVSLAATMAILGCAGTGGNDGPSGGGEVGQSASGPPEGTTLLFPDSNAVALEWASGITTPLTETLMDDAEFTARWNEAMSVQTPAPPSPSIDFESESVILVAQGQKPSTGHRIQIDSALWRSDRVDVYVTAASPDPTTCMTGAAISNPIHMVRIPRTDLPIRFHLDSIIQTC